MNRRTFLAWFIGGVGAAIGAVLGGAGFTYFLSPLFKRGRENWIDVGQASGMKAGTPERVEFVVRTRDAWATAERRLSAWVLTSNRKDFIVFDPRCPHLGCPYRWDGDRGRFLCPCHTAVFDVDGRVVSGPSPRPLDRFPSKVVGGRLLISPRAVKQEEA